MQHAGIDIAPSRQFGMTADQFDRIRKLVYDRSGIFFQDRKKYLLDSRVGQRMRALGFLEFESYFAGIAQRNEAARLLNAVTINETYFFRNPGQFEVLTHEILPSIVAKKREAGLNTINVWSAGCSTGDESYTLAILMEEHLRSRYPEFQFSITGTDINTEVLDRARRGVYGHYAIRNVPDHLMSKYFEQDGSNYILSPQIRNNVRFAMHNLMDPSGPAHPCSFDVVLCANVLIYFDIPARRRAAASIHRRLSGGGALLLGFSESLGGVSEEFAPVRYSRMVAYRKA
ncbi:MAG: protein-glutamate O-methyltransferase CheR [Rhodothermales bacterium]